MAEGVRHAGRPPRPADSAVLVWHQAGLQVIQNQSLPALDAARLLAYLGVAQYDALEAMWRARFAHGGSASGMFLPDLRADLPHADEPLFPGGEAAVNQVSAEVLEGLYPAESPWLDQLLAQRLAALPSGGGELAAGCRMGHLMAQQAMARAATDHADHAQDPVVVPTGQPWFWFSSLTPPAPPYGPYWSHCQPWVLNSADQFRVGPPPTWGSSQYLAALAEVRHISETRTAEQTAIALHWADDGPHQISAPGRWDLIACEALASRTSGELRKALVLALVDVAMDDASIVVWDTKYTYWLIRPSQADPAITMPIGLPNFPSYTSGHSGFAGAAATVLSRAFPEQSREFATMAEEDAISRVYGGVHYRFDCEVGLRQGQQVGQLVLQRARGDGA